MRDVIECVVAFFVLVLLVTLLIYIFVLLPVCYRSYLDDVTNLKYNMNISSTCSSPYRNNLNIFNPFKVKMPEECKKYE